MPAPAMRTARWPTRTRRVEPERAGAGRPRAWSGRRRLAPDASEGTEACGMMEGGSGSRCTHMRRRPRPYGRRSLLVRRGVAGVHAAPGRARRRRWRSAERLGVDEERRSLGAGGKCPPVARAPEDTAGRARRQYARVRTRSVGAPAAWKATPPPQQQQQRRRRRRRRCRRCRGAGRRGRGPRTSSGPRSSSSTSPRRTTRTCRPARPVRRGLALRACIPRRKL